MSFTVAELQSLRSLLFDAATDAILLVDGQGSILLTNHSADLSFGTSTESLQILSIRSLIPLWDECAEQLTTAVPPDVPVIEREAVGMHQNGGLFPIWITVRSITFVNRNLFAIVVRDRVTQQMLLDEKAQIIAELHQSQEASLNIMEDLVAQRKQLETINQALSKEIAERKRLEANRAQLAAIVESSSDAIIGNSLDGVVESWNAGAATLFGYTPLEIIGKTLRGVLVPRERQQEFDELMERVRRGEQVNNFETVHIRKNGHRLVVSLTVSPIRDQNGGIVGASSIARDVTKRVEIERELALHRDHLENVIQERTQALLQSREKLRQSERLASIGALAAGIAHEINNPIGAIMLCADNALNRRDTLTNLPEALNLLERTCQKVLGNARRCGLIVKGILQFSRKQATEKRPCDINSIARTAIQLITESLDMRGNEIHCDLDEGLPPCPVNQVEIEQVFVNLVKNALESTTENVRVDVSTRRTDHSVSIIVQDNGPGMSDEQQQHIFDPFFTTRQQQGGTGLGMSIVHGIVVDHNGSIDVSSKVGEGSRITIQLPFSPVKAEDLTAH
ncbi:MAG: PAS domain S-box protein [Bdellovibrionota bacterium]